MQWEALSPEPKRFVLHVSHQQTVGMKHKESLVCLIDNIYKRIRSIYINDTIYTAKSVLLAEVLSPEPKRFVFHISIPSRL